MLLLLLVYLVGWQIIDPFLLGDVGEDLPLPLFLLDFERRPSLLSPRLFSEEPPRPRERERDDEYERREEPRRVSFRPRGGDTETLRLLLPVSRLALDEAPSLRESLLASSFLPRLLEDDLPLRRPPPRLSLDEYFPRPPRESGEESDPEEEDDDE
eukprot:CAMPEP_0201674048 /NCGR_PEP_ID=MMETSP0494-20130426/36148_1 /ASSEMBLY_ACC=CAM_ASM_000839 /TAXON_ID=420259 /ORGANISM="Thalassiosira gravida, Strain GMp14c1" /LENGTH=155 /DNA_ID=CAMNT_0048156099 /DNA_START=248 /DNA_END=716 /DNA_ORIENTATION=+